jgi:alkanesulfonate monooxygenase SsuD/methylene tetrahydromethanopterin reductase-like flavin-dependent oxidoreductase (luciferase family)
VQDCGRRGSPILIARVPLARLPERFARYEAGLAESGLDAQAQRTLRESAAVWRWVHVAESDAQAEDELGAALLETRRHQLDARAAHNPPDFHVAEARVNPWNDPHLSHEDGVRYALAEAALWGTPARVAEQVEAMRDAGARHVLCQMSVGFLPHVHVMASMRSFGERVLPRFR